MTFMEFRDALFEVVDLWTPEVDAHEYASFLLKLYDRITMRQHDGRSWRRQWKLLQSIESFIDTQLSPENERFSGFLIERESIQDLDLKPLTTRVDPPPPELPADKPPIHIFVQISKKERDPRLVAETETGNQQNDDDQFRPSDTQATKKEEMVDARNKRFAKAKNNDWRPWWLRKNHDEPFTTFEKVIHEPTPCLKTSSSIPMKLSAIPPLKTSPSVPIKLDVIDDGRCQAWSARERGRQYAEISGCAAAGETLNSSRQGHNAEERRRISRLHEAISAANENRIRHSRSRLNCEADTVKRVSFDATGAGRNAGIGRTEFTWAKCNGKAERRPASASCAVSRKAKVR
jgi:hypothetical protein